MYLVDINKKENSYAFISYSSSNRDSADALRNMLTSRGIDSWMAPYDIPVGEKYAGVINRAVKNCGCLVLLLTDSAQSSQWVEKEVERAINYNKTIVTIKLEDIILNDVFEFFISSSQVVAIPVIKENDEELEKVIKVITLLTKTEEKSTEKNSVPDVILRSENAAETNEIVKPEKRGKVIRKFEPAMFFKPQKISDEECDIIISIDMSGDLNIRAELKSEALKCLFDIACSEKLNQLQKLRELDSDLYKKFINAEAIGERPIKILYEIIKNKVNNYLKIFGAAIEKYVKLGTHAWKKEKVFEITCAVDELITWE